MPSQGRRYKEVLVVSFKRTLILIMRPCLHDLIISQKYHIQIPSHWGLTFNKWIWGVRDINIQAIAKFFTYSQSCSLFLPHKNFAVFIYIFVIYLPVVLIGLSLILVGFSYARCASCCCSLLCKLPQNILNFYGFQGSDLKVVIHNLAIVLLEKFQNMNFSSKVQALFFSL